MVPAAGPQPPSPPRAPPILLSQTMPEMTEKTALKKPHRKKNRETHNAVERHRKKKINAGINRIGELIPCSPALKQSKIMILDQAYKYIMELKRQNDELLLNGGNSEQAEEIKKLRTQLDDLQKENARYIALLKANDICLYDDPTIHWKGNLKNAKVSVVIPGNPMQKKKGSFGSAKVSVVIPSDQVQKNIIVYSNGSQLGGNNQGASVQGITFNIGHNLPKQTANVVPVQRTCNLVTPVTLSGIYSTEIKSGAETSVPPSASSGLPNLAKKTLEPSTSENKQSRPLATGAVSSQNALKLAETPPVLQDSPQGEEAVPGPKNGQESSSGLPKEAGVSSNGLSSMANAGLSHAELAVVIPEEDLRNRSQESCDGSVADSACIPPAKSSTVDGFPSGNLFRSPDGNGGGGVPATSAVEVMKAVTNLSPLPATMLEKWPFPGSSAISTPGSKNRGSLAHITSTGNTQTTWTTLQLAGNTVQPVNHTSSGIMAALLKEPASGPGAAASVPNRCSAPSTGLSHLPPVDEQPPEPIVVTLPSGPSLPMQPVVTKTPVLAQLAGSLLPLNSAMQVIQMAQPMGSAVTASPANQNVIILQPPGATPCPPVLRADVPNQTVSQQIVIIQTANQNPLPLFSAPPPPPAPVRGPVNGASPAGGAGNPAPNASGSHTFGGKHLVHILPRPSSSSSSSSTQTLSVAVSNQQLPQTVSLSGQLFALKPVKSCSGASDQAPMQIIQPTTSEDPNTNVALNTFGALANLNQSISQMAGQSCLQLSIGQPANLTVASSQPTPGHCVPLAATTSASSLTPENALVAGGSHLAGDSPQKPTAGLCTKRPNKKTSSKKCLVAGSGRANPCSRDSKKLDGKTAEATAECPGSDVLLEKTPVGMGSQGGRRGALDSASDAEPRPKERAEQGVDCASAPELNATAVPKSFPPESALPSQFGAVAPDSRDAVSLSLQTKRPQANNLATNLQLSDPPKHIPTSPSASLDLPAPMSQIPGMSVTSNGASVESVPGAESLENCGAGRDCSIVVQAADLLEGQGLTKMLSELSGGEAVQKTFSVQVAHSNFPAQSAKPMMDARGDLIEKEDELLLMNAEGENLTQSHSCPSEPEAGSSSLMASRQADSPMSTSSGSSCGFSVASMLPNTCRETVPSSTSVNTCNSCTFSEQTDIVALAARAIFDQETLAKGAGAVAQSAAPKGEDIAALGREQPFKSHAVKDATQIETAPSSFGAQNSVQMNMDRSAEKQSCSVRVEMPSTDLLAPQSSNASSLSVNNLIHPSCIIHPAASCSGLPLASDQAAIPATGTPSVSAASYMSQSPGKSPALIAEYSPEQLSVLRTSAMQAPPQVREPHLKPPSQESRKDSAKRSVQDDHLLSASKRQKQCPAGPLRLEGMALLNQAAADMADQTQILVGQIPPNSSNPAVSVSGQGHADGSHSRLFPASNFVPSALRQAEVQCNPQASVPDQPGQQHLPSLQHPPTQGMVHLHSNYPYIKQQQQQQQQQQQVGQLRDRHHLYQLQHHVPHTEPSLHTQAHNVHQQRVMQQEAQMQKKRSLIQAAQPTPLALQQKHHGNEQARQKGGQPHPHHPQIQQMQQHFAPSQPEKGCENPAGSRAHHSHPQGHLNPDVLHQQQPDVGNRPPGSGVSSEHVAGHGQMQRLMTSRSLEQQMVSQPSIVSRPSDMPCAPHRQERNRVSSYSAEALIGKSPSNSEQRIGISIQSARVPDQLEMRNYLDISRNKGLTIHNMQGRMSIDHTIGTDVQRLTECQTFKVSGNNQQPGGNFNMQSSRNSDIGNAMPSLRGMQTQAFRIAQNAGASIDRPKRLSYQPVQGISTGNALPPSRDNDNSCHQGFMQSLLAPHLGDPSGGSQRSISEHQRNPQCGSSSIVEYNCPPARENMHLRRDGEGQNRESCDMSLGTISNRSGSLNIPFSSSSSSGDIQGRNTSPSVSIQKTNPMRMTESHGSKGHMNPPVSSNVHGGVRPALPHPPVSRGNGEQVPPSVRPPNSSVTQRSRHPLQDNGGSKIRQPERNRSGNQSGNQRHGNVFDPSIPHLPLSAGGSMILGRQQPALEKRGGIVRFMPDGPQVSNDSAAPDQHSLSQNFGFPFIPEGGMNPPINANASFIPPVTQPSATRTPALIPVDPQNTLPSFYPPYSPAHPTLSNDISIPYFPNQMFPNPGTEKPNGGGLNNRFGSILSPPRAVGFAQPSFPLLTDMPPMHMANSSHLSNFNLTSLFPEIATALPPDGSAISPLLSIANTSASDSSKQTSTRPAHNISHILGHDCSSAV